MLKIQSVATDQLKPNPHAVRTHPKDPIDALAKSIQTFGFVVPIIANPKKEILLGTARLMAAGKLGLKAVPVILLDNLSPALQRGLALADNKIA